MAVSTKVSKVAPDLPQHAASTTAAPPNSGEEDTQQQLSSSSPNPDPSAAPSSPNPETNVSLTGHMATVDPDALATVEALSPSLPATLMMTLSSLPTSLAFLSSPPHTPESRSSLSGQLLMAAGDELLARLPDAAPDSSLDSEERGSSLSSFSSVPGFASAAKKKIVKGLKQISSVGTITEIEGEDGDEQAEPVNWDASGISFVASTITSSASSSVNSMVSEIGKFASNVSMQSLIATTTEIDGVLSGASSGKIGSVSLSSTVAVSAVKKVASKLKSMTSMAAFNDIAAEEELNITVSIDPAAHDVVAASFPAIQELLLATLRAIPSSKDFVSTDRDAAQLLLAAGYRMIEQARIDSAEIDLGRDDFASDLASLNAFLPHFDEPQEYSQEERGYLSRGHSSIAMFDAAKRKKTFKTGTKLATAQYSVSGSKFFTQASAEIRVPIKNATAYQMYLTPKYFAATNSGAILEASVVERPNNHRYTLRILFDAPSPLARRELITTNVWERVSDTEFFFVCASTEHTNFPILKDAVRVDVVRAVTLKQIASGVTSVDVVQYTDLKFPVTGWITKQLVLPPATGTPLSMQLYFAMFRPANEVDKNDAKELGMIMIHLLYVLRGNEKLLREELFKLVSRVAVLRRAQAKHRYVVELLLHVIRNKYGTIGSASPQSRLRQITADEMGGVGKSLANIIMSNVTGDAAVDEWIRGSLPLQEMSAEYSWFRPMMETVAAELLSRANFGLVARSFVGAGLSFLDMVSDAYIMFSYFEEDREEFAYAIIAMVALNILIQLLIVLCQTIGLKQDRWRTMFLDMLYTITFVKAGVDAFRVAGGTEENEGAVMSPLTEMIAGKYIEMFTVSVAKRMCSL
jgi:hypothetical protein